MAISTRPLPYQHQGITLTGHLAWDDTLRDPRPGLLLVHGGAGLDDHARAQAERYAGLGYVVLACDMFGDEPVAGREQMMARIMRFRDDPDSTCARAGAGLEALSGVAGVSDHIGAVGFCFGGMTALMLARAGAELAGVVSVHGSLKTPKPAQPGMVRARVLACHGALDPHVPMTDVAAFAEEMDAASVDWEMDVYGGAMHGFTHAGVEAGTVPGVAYNADADQRSFAAAGRFLAEVLS